MSIALLGVPTNSSGTIDGVARAPAALRRAGLVERLERVASLLDLGDIVVERPSPTRAASGIVDAENLAATLSLVRSATMAARHGGHWPLLVGGDCPILMGAIAGCADATSSVPGLLFVDGHEDAWPPKASTTGEAADMELGLLLGRSIDDLEPKLRAQIPRLAPAGLVVLGARDRAEIEAAGVPSLEGTVEFHDDLAVRSDPGRVAREAVRRLNATGADWWLHVDLDVLSSEALPAVDYVQDGGLSWSELSALTKAAVGAGGCVGATVTIYNPDLDPDGRHAQAIVDFLTDLGSYAEPTTGRAPTRVP